MLLITFFCAFVFSTLGLGILLFSQLYFRTNNWRKDSLRIDYASENGIKIALAEVMRGFEDIPLPKLITEEEYQELREGLGNPGQNDLPGVLNLSFPIEILETTARVTWSSRAKITLESCSEGQAYFQARYTLSISAEGRTGSLRTGRKSSLRGRFDVLGGHIPLAAFPLLIDRNLDAGQQANFLSRNEIELVSWPGNLLPARPSFVAETVIPQTADSFVEKAMNIKIFRPQDLSPRKIRQVLGLEESEDPVSEGVYLIQNDLGLGGIYVEGDVDEVIVAIEEDFQVISFRMGDDSWLLKFSPSRSETYFDTPGADLFFDLVPLGIIIVSGKVKSFGGGTIDPSGKIVLSENEETPSLLQGVNLTLVASDEITITSHLIRQGVTWQDGIPYLKEKGGQLMIFSTGRDFWGDSPQDGGIAIGSDAPEQLKIQASLTAAGKGFSIRGEDKAVELAGSLQAADYVSSGARLKIYAQNPSGIQQSSAASVEASKPVVFISFFEILEWREH